MKRATIILKWYEKEKKKAILSRAMHGPIKYNTHFCQSKELSVTDSGTGTVSLRCLSPHERGDYVSHSVFWVTKLLLRFTTKTDLLLYTQILIFISVNKNSSM